MRPADLIGIERQLFNLGEYDGKFLHPTRYALSPVVKILLDEREKKITTPEANALLDKLRNVDVRDDFVKYLYKNALNQQYAVNVSGGEEKHAYLFSFGVDRNKGALSEIYNRTTLRLQQTFELLRNLELSTNVYLIKSTNQSGARGYDAYKRTELPLTARLIDEGGKELPLSTYNTAFRQEYMDTLGKGMLLDWNYYPLQNYKHEIARTEMRYVNAQFGLSYKFNNGLSLSAEYNYQQEQTEKNQDFDMQSFYTRDLINRFSQLNYDNNTVIYKVPKGGIRDYTTNNRTAQDLRGQINFSETFNDHRITAIAGVQVNKVITGTKSDRIYGIDERGSINRNIDFENAYLNLVTRETEYIPTNFMLGGTNYFYFSLYSNATYTLNDRYGIYLSGRRDAMNVFGVDTKNKWKPLWSSGLSWLISNERFYHSKGLPYLKARVTYGKSGNVDAIRIGDATIRQGETNSFVNASYARLDNAYNPEWRWEEVAMLNIGFDFKLKDNKLTGSFEFFRKYMNDLYNTVPLDVTTGMTSLMTNSGKMTGTGIDLELNANNRIGEFMIASNLVMNIYKDKVIQLKSKDLLTAGNVSAGSPTGFNGHSLYALFAYRSAQLHPLTGEARGYLNGQASSDYDAILNNTRVEDLVFTGNMLPTVSGSLTNAISWKKFTITACVIYKLGYVFRRTSIDYEQLTKGLVGHGDYYKRWKNKGNERYTTVPSLPSPLKSGQALFYNSSSDLTTKGDHARLKTLSLSYDLQEAKIGNGAFKHIQLYATLNDVGIVWKANKEGIDPDHQAIHMPMGITCGTRLTF
jgi:hypothetical protein